MIVKMVRVQSQSLAGRSFCGFSGLTEDTLVLLDYAEISFDNASLSGNLTMILGSLWQKIFMAYTSCGYYISD